MNNEKKKLAQNRFWATAQIIYEKKKLYCKPCNCIARDGAGKIVVKKKIVLQYLFLYCREEDLKGWKYLAIGRIVLQLNVKWVGIVLQPGRKVYCNIACWLAIVLQYSCARRG